MEDFVRKKSEYETKGRATMRRKRKGLACRTVSALLLISLCCLGAALVALNRDTDGTSRTVTGETTPRETVEKKIVVPAGKLSELSEYPRNKKVFVRKTDGTLDTRPNNLEELCKDWLYYRKKILEHVRAGKAEKAARARQSFQKVNTWLDKYHEDDIGAMFGMLEKMGYGSP